MPRPPGAAFPGFDPMAAWYQYHYGRVTGPGKSGTPSNGAQPDPTTSGAQGMQPPPNQQQPQPAAVPQSLPQADPARWWQDPAQVCTEAAHLLGAVPYVFRLLYPDRCQDQVLQLLWCHVSRRLYADTSQSASPSMCACPCSCVTFDMRRSNVCQQQRPRCLHGQHATQHMLHPTQHTSSPSS